MTSEQEPGITPAREVMLTVSAVARRLGVAPSTLRTWDRRYGLGPSAHSAGSHRRYGPDDMARLVVMRGLVNEGVPPAEAAQLALGTDPDAPTSLAGAPVPVARYPLADDLDLLQPLDPATARFHDLVGLGGFTGLDGLTEVLDEELSGVGDVLSPPPRAPGTARAGGGRVVSLPDASPRARGLARAAMALDQAEISRLLREAVAVHGVIGAWNELALPVLSGLGERWRATGEGVEVEHALSESLLSVLRGVGATLHRPRNVRPVMLACADGDHHSLPLHVLSAALAEVEVGSRVLGPGLPARAMVSAVRRIGPAAVFVYARLPVLESAVLGELPRQRPAPRIVVGGRGWEDVAVPASVVRVDSLRDAVDELLTSLHV